MCRDRAIQEETHTYHQQNTQPHILFMEGVEAPGVPVKRVEAPTLGWWPLEKVVSVSHLTSREPYNGMVVVAVRGHTMADTQEDRGGGVKVPPLAGSVGYSLVMVPPTRAAVAAVGEAMVEVGLSFCGTSQ